MLKGCCVCLELIVIDVVVHQVHLSALPTRYAYKMLDISIYTTQHETFLSWPTISVTNRWGGWNRIECDETPPDAPWPLPADSRGASSSALLPPRGGLLQYSSVRRRHRHREWGSVQVRCGRFVTALLSNTVTLPLLACSYPPINPIQLLSGTIILPPYTPTNPTQHTTTQQNHTTPHHTTCWFPILCKHWPT